MTFAAMQLDLPYTSMLAITPGILQELHSQVIQSPSQFSPPNLSNRCHGSFSVLLTRVTSTIAFVVFVVSSIKS